MIVTEPSAWLQTRMSSLPESQAMPVGPSQTVTAFTTLWKVDEPGSLSMNETWSADSLVTARRSRFGDIENDVGSGVRMRSITVKRFEFSTTTSAATRSITYRKCPTCWREL